MKKLIYICITLLVLGGIAFALSNTGLLKGSLNSAGEAQINFSVSSIEYIENEWSEYVIAKICMSDVDSESAALLNTDGLAVTFENSTGETDVLQYAISSTSDSCELEFIEESVADLGITGSGSYTITVTVDKNSENTSYDNLYAESDETDNSLTETITIEGEDVDSDGDGLIDSDETALGTDTNNADTDGDSLADGDEVNTHGTDPLLSDTDAGGITDDIELSRGTNPNDSSDDNTTAAPDDDEQITGDSIYLVVANEDGEFINLIEEEFAFSGTLKELEVQDGFYILHFESGTYDITITTEGYEEATLEDATTDGSTEQAPYEMVLEASDEGDVDSDGDGLGDTEEAMLGTDDNNSDTDGDNLSDGDEVNIYGTDPLLSDTDGGGVADNIEFTKGTDPNDSSDDMPVEDEEIEDDEPEEEAADDDEPAEEDAEEPEEEPTEDLTYICSEINIDPDSYTLVSNEDVEMTVTITPAQAPEVTSFWGKIQDLLAGLIPNANWLKASSTEDLTETYWEGTLVLETDGQGTLTDEDGNTGNISDPLEIAVSWTSEEIDLEKVISYSGGSADEKISAYIKGEDDCSDSLTVSATVADTTTSTSTTDTSTTDTSATTTTTTDDTATATSTDTDTGDSNTSSSSSSGSNTTSSTSSSGNSSSTTSSGSSDDDDDDDDNDDNSVIALETILSSKSYSCSEPFYDVDDDSWFWSNICRLFNGDIVKGRSTGYFVPEDYMTKAEAIKILMLLSGHTEDEADGQTEGFADVNSSDWFYPYMVIAQDEDVARVRDGELFYPNSDITRGQFMLFMVRTAGETLYGWDENDIPFSDIKVKDPYTYAIIIGYNTWVDHPEDGTVRVFEGYSNGTSGATKPIARSEAMALALRFYLAWYAN